MKALLVIAAFAVLTFSPAPGWAWGNHGRSQPSVFPQPFDPWSHWGRVHSHSPTVIVSPRAPAVVVRPGAVVHRPRPLWVPGFWGWNGFTWVWVPGAWHW